MVYWQSPKKLVLGQGYASRLARLCRAKKLCSVFGEKRLALSLDADEIMTPEAVAEVKEIVSGETAGKCDGYKILRVLYIGEHQYATVDPDVIS